MNLLETSSNKKPNFSLHKYELSTFCDKYGRTKELNKFLFFYGQLPLTNSSGKCFVAGGAIRKILEDEKQTDIDVFFDCEEAFATFISDIESSFKITQRYENDFNNTYELVFEDVPEDEDFNCKSIKLKVQAIKLYHPDIKSLLDSFDFTICQFAIEDIDGELFLLVGPYTLYDLARKRLHVHKVSYGASTARRLIKYANKGYTACQGTMVDFLRKITENPSSVEEDIEYID